MELWELNACVKEYTKTQQENSDRDFTLCWQTAAFTGSAFGGKLKKLSAYQKDNKKANAPNISKEEFEQRLAMAERG